MSLYNSSLKKVELEHRLSRATKEIDFEELGEVYYRIKNKYTGYTIFNMSRIYLNNDTAFMFVDNFQKFVDVFKSYNYRVL